MVVEYTLEDLYRDRNDKTYFNGHCGYNIKNAKNYIDLDYYAGGPGIIEMYEMAEWCINNCNSKWSLKWNEEEALFEDETDAIAFKLRWF